MKRALSVDTLKRYTTPRITAAPVSVNDVAKRPDTFTVSRRQALGIAGALSLAAAPMASAVESALSSTYTVVRRGKRLAFVVAGKERWVIDPRHFSGNPSVIFGEDDDGLHIELKGAYYPGTSYKADFKATISRGSTPTLDFRIPHSGFRARSAFVPWLLDRASLEGTTHKTVDCLVGDAHVDDGAGR